jgi:NADH-quinone oxidoreductase subunit M
MYQRTFLGKRNENGRPFLDLNFRDWVPLVPLIVLMVWLGSYTPSFMPRITTATSHLLEQTNLNNQYKVFAAPPGNEVADVR